MLGYILHANDVSQQEMQQHFYNHPTLTGISPEMVAAVAAVSLQFLQMKATAVSPVAQASVVPHPEGNAEVDQKPREQLEMDDLDPLTSDDEENELRDANKKNEDIVEQLRIRRSAKVAKKAKNGKGATASTAAASTVKSTISKPAA